MLQAYFAHGMHGHGGLRVVRAQASRRAQFPDGRGPGAGAGLPGAAALRARGARLGGALRAISRPGSSSSLAELRFTGDVHAMPEGTVFFPDEPILRVTAPLPEAQLVESRLHQPRPFPDRWSRPRPRAACSAAPGKLLVDFGLRRAHGAEAGLLAARASYVAGFSGTATVLAAPAIRHSGVRHDGAFVRAGARRRSGGVRALRRGLSAGTTLLIDTYDTEAAARKVVALAARLSGAGHPHRRRASRQRRSRRASRDPCGASWTRAG